MLKWDAPRNNSDVLQAQRAIRVPELRICYSIKAYGALSSALSVVFVAEHFLPDFPRIPLQYKASEHNFLLDLDGPVVKLLPEFDSRWQHIFSLGAFPDDGEPLTRAARVRIPDIYFIFLGDE